MYKRRQRILYKRKKEGRNPRHPPGNDRVMGNQFVQPDLPTNQYLETENIKTVPSCPNYFPEEFNTGYQFNTISDNPPSYILDNPLQCY